MTRPAASPDFGVEDVAEGLNSVLFSTGARAILYEKISNTVHAGSRAHLQQLQGRVESVPYCPAYEAESLRKTSCDAFGGLVLEVTERCDLACSYCIYSGRYSNQRRESSSCMTLETARMAVDLFMSRAAEPALISFYGGEPLNNMPLINDTVAYCRDTQPARSMSFSMTTNFVNADRHFESIVKNNMFLVVSLDGPETIHDRHRRLKNGRPTWRRIMRNLSELDDYAPGFVRNHVGFSATCVEPSDFPLVVEFFDRHPDFKLFRIGGCETKGLGPGLHADRSAYSLSPLARSYYESVVHNQLIPDAARVIIEPQLRTIARRGQERMPAALTLNGACYPGNRKLFVETDGALYMCEKIGRRRTIGHVAYGLSKASIDGAIDEYTSIRNDLCRRGCWAQRLCTPCVESAKDPAGGFSVTGLYQTCGGSKHMLLVCLGLYATLASERGDYLAHLREPTYH